MKYLKTYELFRGASVSGALAKDLDYFNKRYNELMRSIGDNNKEKFNELIKITNLEDTDKEGNTALLIASSYGRKKMVKKLIDSGVNTSHLNNDGDSFYDLAVDSRLNNVKGWIEKNYPEHVSAIKYNL
jgi:ankyrin repeat protein